ncbi:MAG: 2-oxoacid:acceptor oxidoreductase family protein [Candidatus Ranarchaeia archaeon]
MAGVSNNMIKTRIRFAGTGGQGMISIAIILGEAISLYDWKYACQTQSYGPESRGSAARADVVVSDTIIDNPKFSQPDILVIMSQGAWEKYGMNLKPKSYLFLDSTIEIYPKESRSKNVKLWQVPCVDVGESLSTSPFVSNVVMLGVVITKTNIVTDLAITRSLQERWPKHAELNLTAFEEGRKLANNVEFRKY